MPIQQLDDHAADAYYGPPLLNGERLPFPSYPGGQVSVTWQKEHQTRKYGDGRMEVVGDARYRPVFTLSYDVLEHLVEYGIWQELKAVGPLTFAPYSRLVDGGAAVPIPLAFEVLPPDEIPDTADLLLARFPFGLSLTGTETWLKAEIPTTLPPGLYECGEAVSSGGQGDTVNVHSLGGTAGGVVLEYEAFVNPDGFELIYQGAVVATTGGLVSGAGTLSWYYPATAGASQFLTVHVFAPNEGTGWEYTLNCPDPSVPPPDPDPDPDPTVDVPDAPANLTGEVVGDDAVWTWDPVEDADAYLLRWGFDDGGPYPNAVFIDVADLVDPDAPTWTVLGAGAVDTSYAIVSTLVSL